MSPLPYAAIVTLAIVAILVAGAIVLAVRTRRRSTALRRMGIDVDVTEYQGPLDASGEPLGTGLRAWLGRAGYRRTTAPEVFIFLTLLAIATGLMITMLARSAGVFNVLVDGLRAVPGEFSQALLPLAEASPWIIFILFATFPFLVVRAARRTRVAAAEEELPVLLELLATLAEAGLGFDAALNEILSSERGVGYLADEFRLFQRETLTGAPRVLCLRRLARRVEVPTVSSFVSSLVQAERCGLGLSDVLRVQANDMRNRRRETALGKAQALPVKLVFPLVLCFLPGLFVLTLGPAFYSFIKIADSVTGGIK